MRWAGRFYRTCLVLLPPELVRRHGDAMVALFEENLDRARRRRGWSGAGAVFVGALVDVARRALVERRVWARRNIKRTRTGGGEVMEGLVHGVWGAARALVRAPRFTFAAVATLALAIGATTAVFTVLDAVLLRPLPFPEPERVVHLAWDRNGRLLSHMPHFKVAYWREHTPALEAVTTHATVPVRLDDGGGEPESVRALAVDRGFFEVVGVRPALGRAPAASDYDPGAPSVVVLTHAFWVERFGGNAGVLGRTLPVGGEPFEIVGVLPDSFHFPYVQGRLDFVVPLGREADPQDEAENFPALARLAPGATVADAERDLARAWERFQNEHAEIVNGTDRGMKVASFRALYAADVGSTLWILFGAVGLVLLTACANVASLLLARATDRRTDVAVRVALGASRGRIVGGVLAESGLIALAAAAAGLGLAVVGVEALLSLNPQPLPRGEEVGLDARVVLFTVLVTGATALLFGLPAALPAATSDGSASLARGSRGASRRTRGRSLLLGAEAALSMVLLVAAGLLVATLVQLRTLDPGFDASDVVAFRPDGLPPEYAAPDALAGWERAIVEATLGAGAVTGAAWTSSLPLERGWNVPVAPEGRPDDVVGGTEWRAIGEGYLDAMDIELIQGRDFGPGDTRASEPVVLVNRAFAEHFFPGGALGERVEIGKYRGRVLDPSFDVAPARVVGVVGDQRDISLRSPARLTVFVPRTQVPEALHATGHLVVEASAVRDAAAAVGAAFERAAVGVDAPRPRPLGDVVAASLARERFHATLMFSFAAVGLVLTAFGIYAVVGYAVRQRRREIGIQMALGADRARVVRRFTLDGLRPVLVGLVVGGAAAVYLGRFLSHLLWGVTPGDPVTVGAVAGVLLAAAGVASWLPAREAAHASPVEALRAE